MAAAGRPDLHILARFLDRMGEPGAGAFTRSQLQRAVRLNYDLFRKYLDVLLERGLVAPKGGTKETFVITAKGRAVRVQLLAWLADLFGGQL